MNSRFKAIWEFWYPFILAALALVLLAVASIVFIDHRKQQRRSSTDVEIITSTPRLPVEGYVLIREAKVNEMERQHTVASVD